MAVTFPYVRAATWVDGSTTDTAAKRNTIEDGIFNAHQAPAVRVTHNAAQSITSGAATALAFNTERFDQAGGSASTMHDTVTNNSRIKAVYAGIYEIVSHGEWAANVANAAGSTIQIRLNGATVIARQFIGNIDIRSWSVATQYSMAVNDYVETIVTQNTGGAVNVASSANYSPEFSMVRIG